MKQDQETNKELASILIQLFKALEDRVIDSKAMAASCYRYSVQYFGGNIPIP